ncbi:MAG: molybdopterin-binding protein [Planctomycetaceae bacterium]
MAAAGLRAEVVAIGDELVTGQRLDTNSQWISRELALLGVPTGFHTTIGDGLDDGVAALRAACARAGVVVVTGGLGPTADDLTRDVLAAVAGVPLEICPRALADVEARFASRGVAMPASNRRQAEFPAGSRPIPNPEGTAPGIDLDRGPSGAGGARVFALPGVPAEMRRMWHDTVGPAILAMLPGAGTIHFRRVKCFGVGESALEAMLPDLVRRGRDPLVGITVHEATITLRIAARGAGEEACAAAIAPVEATIRRCLGGLVFGVEDDEIEDAALGSLAAAGATVASVEVATEGRVAALLAEGSARRPGSGTFLGGVVLTDGAAGDGEVAAMARRRRDEAGATHGLAVGRAIAAAGERPTVSMALDGPEGTCVVRHRLVGASDVRIVRVAKAALDLVRRVLDGLPPQP